MAFKVRGEPAEVAAAVKALGGDMGAMYNSSSKGLIPITSMAQQHIRNALLLKYETFVRELRSKSNANLVVALREGPEDEEFLALVSAFVSNLEPDERTLVTRLTA